MNSSRHRRRQRGPIGICALAASLLPLSTVVAAAKEPGHTYCINDVCRRVLTLAETGALVGVEAWEERTSYYDACEADAGNPCTASSSGETFAPERPDNAASPIYPNGTVLELYYPASDKRLTVRTEDPPLPTTVSAPGPACPWPCR